MASEPTETLTLHKIGLILEDLQSKMQLLGEVMEQNKQEILASIEDRFQRIERRLDVLEATVRKNSADIQVMMQALRELQVQTIANTEAISVLQVEVRKNSEDIRKNSEDIRKNSEDIRKNSEDIARQAREIEALRLRLDQIDRRQESQFLDLEGRVTALEDQVYRRNR